MPRFNSKFVGYIPETLKYVQRPAKEVSDYWEHDFWSGDEKRKGVHLRETFVVDANNPKTLETAMRWAQGWGQKEKGVTVTERPNNPIPSIEIISLDIRSEGGRAWKVLLDGLYYVDLREDVLLDALRNGKGVVKGELRGPFVWCGVGSVVKLVRVGSQLHQAVLEAGVRKASKNVKTTELVLGGIYENRKGEHFQYLGQIDCERYMETNYKARYTRGSGETKPHFKVDTVRNQQLWLEIPSYWKGKTDEFWTRDPIRTSVPDSGYYHRGEPEKPIPESAGWTMSLYRLEIVKSKAIVGLVQTAELPEGYLGRIQNMIRENWDAEANYYAHSRNPNRESTRLSTIAYHSWQLTLRGVGQPVPTDIKDFNPLLNYVKNQPPEVK